MTVFVAVAELKGFAPAARRLGLSPSVVTRLVAALEQRLSIRLLQRTTRSVALTDAGSRYLEQARRILAAIDDAEATARAGRAEPFGRFVVSAPAVFGRRHVSPLLRDFLNKYPAVTGELRLADRMVNLVEEGVDIAVRIGALEDSSLHARLVGKTRQVLVGSPEYLARQKRPLEPHDLASHSMIHFTALREAPELLFYKDGVEQRIIFNPSLVTNSADVAIDHAASGAGLTATLSYQVIDLVRSGKLEVVLSKYEAATRPIHLLFPASRLASANLTSFIALTTGTRDWNFENLTEK